MRARLLARTRACKRSDGPVMEASNIYPDSNDAGDFLFCLPFVFTDPSTCHLISTLGSHLQAQSGEDDVFCAKNVDS